MYQNKNCTFKQVVLFILVADKYVIVGQSYIVFCYCASFNVKNSQLVEAVSNRNVHHIFQSNSLAVKVNFGPNYIYSLFLENALNRKL